MATVQEQLDEARGAYHALMTGRSVVEVEDQNGERIKYTPANANKLASYISELERKISGGCGPLGVYI